MVNEEVPFLNRHTCTVRSTDAGSVNGAGFVLSDLLHRFTE